MKTGNGDGIMISYLPVVERREAEGLALGVRAQICLKAERVDDRDERLDRVQRRPWLGGLLRDVATATREHGVDGGNAVGWRLDLNKVVGLHQARRSLRHNELLV